MLLGIHFQWHERMARGVLACESTSRELESRACVSTRLRRVIVNDSAGETSGVETKHGSAHGDIFMRTVLGDPYRKNVDSHSDLRIPSWETPDERNLPTDSAHVSVAAPTSNLFGIPAIYCNEKYHAIWRYAPSPLKGLQAMFPTLLEIAGQQGRATQCCRSTAPAQPLPKDPGRIG